MTKKTEQAEFKPENAAQRFYKEMAELKPFLPKDYKIKFLEMHPEYDSYKGGLLIHNVVNGNSTDMVILEALKKIAIYPKNKKV